MALPQPQQADINRIPTEFPLIVRPPTSPGPASFASLPLAPELTRPTASLPQDSDPHFQRVVRFFRPSDWAWTVASPFGGVGFLYLYGACSAFGVWARGRARGRGAASGRGRRWLGSAERS